jgi:Zn-dependent protease
MFGKRFNKSGLPMKGITLFIFGGVAEMGDEPPNAKTEFLIAIAGPLSSIAIGNGLFA